MGWNAAFEITASVFIVFGIYMAIKTLLSFFCGPDSFLIAVPAVDMTPERVSARLALARIYSSLDTAFGAEPVLLFAEPGEAESWRGAGVGVYVMFK